MAEILLHVTDTEKIWIEKYADIQGLEISDVIKKAFFEKMEDELDLQMINEYEEQRAVGNIKLYTHNEIINEFFDNNGL